MFRLTVQLANCPRAENVYESASLCFALAAMLLFNKVIIDNTTSDPTTIASYVVRCKVEKKVIEPVNLFFKSAVIHARRPAVSIPYHPLPPGSSSFLDFARKLFPTSFKEKQIAKRKRIFLEENRATIPFPHHGSSSTLLLSDEKNDSRESAKRMSTELQPRSSITVRIDEFAEPEEHVEATSVEIYGEHEVVDELYEKIRLLQKRIQHLEGESTRSKRNEQSSGTKDEDYCESPTVPEVLTFDRILPNKTLNLRIGESKNAPFDIRVKLAAVELVLNHGFSRQQHGAAVRVISHLVGYDVEFPTPSTVSRWRELITSLVSFDCVNVLLSNNGFLAMETDGTSMKMSKALRTKIQATRLTATAGAATFPCVVVWRR